jgi:hypothetical protein
MVAAANYVGIFNAGDTIRLFWASGEGSMILNSDPSFYGGPDNPSAMITIVPVGA